MARKKAVVVPTTTPIKRYSMWAVTRSNGVVVFGCGAVRIRQADLRRLADLQEKNPLMVDTTAIRTAQQHARSLSLTVEDLKVLSQFVDTQKSNAYAVAARIARASGGRKNVGQILRLTPQRLREIAG